MMVDTDSRDAYCLGMTETEVSEYRIEIDVTADGGAIWQTVYVERVPRKVVVEGVAPVDAFDLLTGAAPVVAGVIWEPFNANEGIGGVPRIMYRAHCLVSTQDLAEDVARDQNVTDGDDWRVRVYVGDDNDHVAEAGPGAESTGLTELAARIRNLSALPPVERAAAAKALGDDARVVLARMRRAAVYEATRAMPWDDVAAALGVSPAAINQLITQHRKGQTS